MQCVIPGLTLNPFFPWIPAFAGMKAYDAINVAMHRFRFFQSDICNLQFAIVPFRALMAGNHRFDSELSYLKSLP
jgi:hypothetical protein